MAENWFSAIHDFHNDHPLMSIALKKVFFFVFIGGITLAWALLGMNIGLFTGFGAPKTKKAQFRTQDSDLDDSTEKILFAVDQVWISFYALTTRLIGDCQSDL